MTRRANVPFADPSQRWRQLRLNVAAGGVARLASGFCALLQVALLVRTLGSDGYGLWVTLLAIAGFITLFDGGVGINIETAMAEAGAHDRGERLRRVFASGFLTLAVLGATYLGVGAISFFFFDWPALMDAAPADATKANEGAVVVVMLTAFNVPFNIAPRLAGALQLGRLHAAWNTAGALTALLFSAVAATLRWPWIAIVTGLSLIPLAQNLGLLGQLWRRLEWPLAWTPPLPWSEWRPRLRKGALLSVPLLGQGLVQVVPPIAIASVGGPSAATAFNLIQRLAAPLSQGLSLLLTPLWPTYVEATARGDRAWLHRMLRLSVIAALGAGLALAGLVFARGRLLPWWVGAGVEVPATAFAWLAGTWLGLNLCGQPLWHFLVGVGRWRPLLVSAVAGHGLALVLLITAAKGGASPAMQLGLGSIGLAGIWLPTLIWFTLQAVKRPDAPGVRA